MPLWTKTTPPIFAPQCKATPRGWQDLQSGEIFVAARELSVKAGPATIREVFFNSLEPTETQPLTVTVVFSEAVDVVAGAEILVDNTGGANITLVANAHSNETRVEFEGTTPAHPGTLSISAQTLSGNVTDSDSQGSNSNLNISSDVASASADAVIQQNV